MKHWILDVLLAIVLVWSISVLASVTAERLKGHGDLPATEQTKPTKQNAVGLLRGEAVTFLPLDEYLTGVLLCEVDANFHDAAKQAQAIAARTYALRVMEIGVKHGPGMICDKLNITLIKVLPTLYTATPTVARAGMAPIITVSVAP